MIRERRQDEISEYRIMVDSEDCHIDRALRKCTVVDGILRGIDEFFAQFEYMKREQKKCEIPEGPDFYARLFYQDGLMEDVMLRKQIKTIDGIKYDAITVARVGVRHHHQKGKGTLKAILNHIEKQADERGWLVLCEQARGALASHLSKRGYVPFTTEDSCKGITDGFSTSWARLPMYRAAIINLPVEVHALCGKVFDFRSSKRMQEIVVEESERMFAIVRARYANEVQPIFEEKIAEIKQIEDKRRNQSIQKK